MLVRKIFGHSPMPEHLVIRALQLYPPQQYLESTHLRNEYRDLEEQGRDDDLSEQMLKRLAKKIGDLVAHQSLTREQICTLREVLRVDRAIVAYETIGLIPEDSIAEKVLYLPSDRDKDDRLIFENGMILNAGSIQGRIEGYHLRRTYFARL